MLGCWKADPKERPSFSRIISKLEIIAGFLTFSFSPESYCFKNKSFDSLYLVFTGSHWTELFCFRRGALHGVKRMILILWNHFVWAAYQFSQGWEVEGN